MRIGVVFNPRSGVRQGKRFYGMTREAIIGSGHTPVFLELRAGHRLEDLVSRLASEVDVIATIGGDGTLNGVVNGILASSCPGTPVAFFPSGRGRDTARTIPSFSLDSLGDRRVDWTSTRAVDVGIVTTDAGTRHFINASNIGLSADASRTASRLPRQVGSFSYVIGAARGFFTTKPASVHIELDGREAIELDDVLLLAVCNGRAMGGGLYLAPNASAEDGQLDLVAIRNARLIDLPLNLRNLRRGTPFEHPALSSWRARVIRVDNTSLSPMDLDGDLWGAVPATYRVAPSALNWIGPTA